VAQGLTVTLVLSAVSAALALGHENATDVPARGHFRR
jgi:hypothetical protein